MTKTEEARRLADRLDAECSYIDALGPAHVTTTRGYHANSRDMLRTLADEVNKLEAENEALRAALESIASCNPLADGDVVEIAREALEREEP